MTHDTLHVTPTPTATDHPPSNSPTMHTKLVHQGRGCKIQNEKKKTFFCFVENHFFISNVLGD